MHTSLDHSPHCCRFTPILALCALVLPILSLSAQVASPAPTPSAAPVQLTPFEVNASGDVGYRAASTTSGTRENEALKDVPASISVMTNDFISDIAATDFTQISEYMVGGSYRPSAYYDYGINFRGFRTANLRRNLIAYGNTTMLDSYIIDRVDVVRGPNSLLLGSAEPGGLMNIETKQSLLGKNVEVVTVGAGSWDDFRGTADINRTINSKLAVRGNFLWENKEGYQDWLTEDRKGAQGTFVYQPDPATTIRGELEGFQRKATRAYPLYQEDYKNWNGTTPFTYNSAPTASTGLSLLSPSTGVNVYRFLPNTGKLVDLRGYGTTLGATGNNDLPVTDTSILPRRSNFAGPSNNINNAEWTYTLSAEHSFGKNLHMIVDFNELMQTTNRFYGFSPGGGLLHRDPNPLMPDGTTNPHYQDYYFTWAWNKSMIRSVQDHIQYTAIYDWQPVDWMQHHFYFNTFRETMSYAEDNYVDAIINNPATKSISNAASNLLQQVYVGDGDTRQNTQFPGLLNDPTTGLKSAFVNIATNAGRTPARIWSRQDSWSVSASSSYWDDKIRTLWGTRQDTFHEDSDALLTDAITGLRSFGARNRIIDNVVASPFYGALVNPFPWLTLYATKSFSFSPASFGYTPVGTPIGTKQGKGREEGVRFDLFHGNVNLTFAHYDLQQTNVSTSVSTAVTNINSIWNDAVVNAAIPNYANNALNPANTAEGVTQGGHGYEAELFLNLGRGLTLTANFSTSDTRQESLPVQTIDYINANLPKWQALSTMSTAIANEVNPRIVNLQTFIASQIPGAQALETYHDMGNVFGLYKFQGGFLKGFKIGGGVNYRSRVLLYSSVVNNLVVSGYGAGTVVWSGLLGYDLKLHSGQIVNIALNVANLTDRTYLEEYGLALTSWAPPRSFMLTCKTTF